MVSLPIYNLAGDSFDVDFDSEELSVTAIRLQISKSPNLKKNNDTDISSALSYKPVLRNYPKEKKGCRGMATLSRRTRLSQQENIRNSNPCMVAGEGSENLKILNDDCASSDSDTDSDSGFKYTKNKNLRLGLSREINENLHAYKSRHVGKIGRIKKFVSDEVDSQK